MCLNRNAGVVVSAISPIPEAAPTFLWRLTTRMLQHPPNNHSGVTHWPVRSLPGPKPHSEPNAICRVYMLVVHGQHSGASAVDQQQWKKANGSHAAGWLKQPAGNMPQLFTFGPVHARRQVSDIKQVSSFFRIVGVPCHAMCRDRYCP